MYKIREKQLLRIWNFLKIILALSLFGFLLSKIRLEDLFQLQNSVSTPWIIIAIFLFYLQSWLIAFRYWILIKKETTFREILNLVVLQNITGNMIASSIGAASYVAILRKKHNVQIFSGISSLLLARFSDLFILVIALLISSVLLRYQIAVIFLPVLSLVAGLVLLIIFFLLIFFLREKFICFIELIIHLLRLDEIVKVRNMIGKTKALAAIKPYKNHRFLSLSILSSISIFCVNIIFSYSCFKVFTLSLGLWIIIFLISTGQLMSLVPVQFMGGLGISEITNLFLFGLFGFEQTKILPILVGMRILYLIVNLFLVLHLIFEGWLRNKPLILDIGK